MFFKRINKKCRVLKQTGQIAAAMAIFFLLSLATVAQAELKVTSFYSDHVVLQQGIPLSIWGTGDVGSKVTLRFAGQSVDGLVTESGTWRVQLKPLQVNNQGKDLIVSDGQYPAGDPRRCGGRGLAGRRAVEYANDGAEHGQEIAVSGNHD